MIKADKYYKKNIRKILEKGSLDENPRPKYKDGTPSYSHFITQVFEEYDISKGEFPITTLRNTAIKTSIKEILWIYQKQNNSLEFAKNMGVNWWDNWDIGDGTIGQRYGATIKKWDLMDKLLINLEKNPFSRRHIINMIQEDDLVKTEGLYPCAYETLWSVRRGNNGIVYIDLTMIQRSNDYIVAGYINKIQYVGLMLMVCNHLNYKPGKFCHYVHNLHIYDRHIDAANEILNKKELDVNPSIELLSDCNFYDVTINDFVIKNIKGISKLNSKLEISI